MQLGCSVIVLTAALLIPNVDGFAVPTNFNCKNSLISDEWRKLVLNFHNGKRRLLAQGKQPSLNLPAPFSTNSKCELNSQTNSILKSWWDEVKKVDLAQSQEFVPGLEHFAPMRTYICITCAAQQKCTAWLCQDDYTPAGDIPPRVCADGMANDLAATALHMHNHYRQVPFDERQIATGWMVDKKDGYAPTAKQMLALEYDCAVIGGQAKRKADNCPSTAPTADPGYSLNHFYAIETWAKQVSTIGVGNGNIYTAGTGVDNYANMAHDEITKFGCAVEVCVRSGSSVVVCEYDRYDFDTALVVGYEFTKILAT
ncbi:SCP-like protein [Ancylostoma ceylanicum]|uniref:SCP-like protein n=1 Tax=Ancylostoma ceylanicum TaxID=53326 RepID=A0A0D6LMD0_9BILA|nr:SCP-like protein [Ancylostoma ceylanicum]